MRKKKVRLNNQQFVEKILLLYSFKSLQKNLMKCYQNYLQFEIIIFLMLQIEFAVKLLMKQKI